MNNFYKSFYVSFLILLSSLSLVLNPLKVFSQCGCNATDFAAISVAGYGVGQTGTITTCQYGGERSTITNTVAGATYRISTCGTGYDTQLSIYTTGCAFLAYNDDNGPSCGGLQASVDFTSPGGSIYSVMNLYSCTSNSTCGTVTIQLLSLPPSSNECANGTNLGVSPFLCNVQSTLNPVNQGDYTQFNVVSGIGYNFNTSGTGYDTKLWGKIVGTGGATLFFQDLNNVAGNNESIDWLSNFGGTIGVATHLSNCNSWNGTSAILRYRQITTVNNTTSTAAICAGGTKPLTYTLTGINNNPNPVWSIVSGGGTISSNDYLPGAYTGPVTLRATLGVCTSDVSFTVNPNPTVSAGGGLPAICQGGTTANLGGSVGGGATGGSWSDGGAGGSFPGGSTNLNTTYTASAGAGSPITLTLTTSGGSCGTTTATKILVVNPNPTVNAGSVLAAICQGGTTAALGGSVGGGATGGTWSDGGAGGTFPGGSTNLNTTYTAPGSSSSPVTLTLTTSGGSCGSVTASKTVVVNPNPTANAGPALVAICQGATTANLGGSVSGGATGGTWSDGGAGGSFSPNATTLDATYTASATAPNPVTLTLTTSGGLCGTTTASKQLAVSQTPNGSISISSPICIGASANLTFNFSAGTGPYNIVYSDGSANFNANGISSGATVSVSPGLGTTSYSLVSISDANTCSRNSGFAGPSASLVVNQLDNAGFTYSANTYCSNVTNPTPTITGLAGGTFTGTAGLFVNSATGVISLASSSTNTNHTVTYTTNGICPNTATFNIFITPADNAGFNYSQASYCQNGGGIVTPTITGLGGGTFSSNSVGLTFNPTDGGITLVSSTPGSYSVTYLTNGVCPNTSTNNVTIIITDDAAFSYSAAAYCVNDATNPLPTITGLTGGTFNSSPVGLSLNASTGQINLASSTVSIPYIVTYTTNGPCVSSSSVAVLINPFPVVSFTGLNTSYCINETNAQPLVGSPSSPGTGVFSGLGIIGNTYTPSLTTIGNHVITYTYTDANSCTNSTTQTTLTNGLPFVNFAGLASQYCVSNTASNPLVGSPTGGTFSGVGVSGNTFNAATAGVGVKSITYTYTDPNGCTNTSTIQTTVYDLPIVAFSGLSSAYCITSSATLLTGFPTGGTFTGTGMTGGNTFDPTVATIGGPYAISYTFTDVNSCTNTATQSTIVNNIPTVSISGIAAQYCNNSAIVPVTVSPSGGTLSGSGISGLTFNPTIAGLGPISLNYTFTDGNNCSNSTSISTTVFAAPTVSFSGLASAYCENGLLASLTGNPVGGTFSGNGVAGLTFNPQTSGTGSQTVTYTYTDGNSCTNSSSNTTNVNSLPVVSFTGLAASYCISQTTPVTLTGNPAGGTFIVNGVVGASFIPSQQTIGVTTISYFFTNANGCTDTTSQTTSIVPAPTVTLTGLAAQYCSSAAAVTLAGSPAGGVFSGPGVSGNTFTPANAGNGSVAVTYAFNDGNGCSNSTVVNTVVNINPIVAFSGLSATYCENLASAPLTGFPAGGTFSGPGIVGNSFNPQTSGTGTKTITYNYTDGNGCSNSITQTTVVNAIPVASFSGLLNQYCLSQTSQANLIATPSGGTFIVNGVVGTTFIPSQQQLGTQTISYFVSNVFGCIDTTTQTTTIVPAPIVSFTGLAANYCANAPVVSLTGTPAGGTYTGAGMIGNTFTPSLAGTGNVGITYTFNDGNGCFNSATNFAVIFAAPTVSFSGLDAAYCANSPLDILTGLPGGGTFSGIGVSGTSFNPQVGGTGSRTITYSFTDGNGCSNIATNPTVVNATPVVTFSGLNSTYCISQTSAVNLVGNPPGGTFIVNGLVGASFIPSQHILGTQTISYFFTNVAGCSDTATQTTTIVNPALAVISGFANQYCSNSPVAILTGSPAGGIFTGPGMLGNVFDPANAGTGNISITYTYNDGNGCISSRVAPTNVFAAPSVAFTGLSASYCVNSPSVTLTGIPTGGTFSGTGVTGNTFNPQIGPSGSRIITYTFTNSNGCTNSTTQTTTVNSVPVPAITSLAAQYCISQTTAVALNGTPSGGTFIVNSIVNSPLIPSQQALGNVPVSYFVVDANGCSDTTSQITTVVQAPSVGLSGMANQYCSNGTSVILTGNPTGGIFSGPGISGNVFNPTLANIGNNTISYFYSDGNGCSNTTTFATTVFAAPTPTIGGLDAAYCVNGPIDQLFGFPAGGTFSGFGASGSNFNPQQAGTGNQVITYSFTDANSCSNNTTSTTIVNPQPTVSFTGLATTYCISNTSSITLVPSPSGGTFNGAGISGSTFTPSISGLGTHTIIYNYTDGNGCSNSAQNITTVEALPVVSITGLSPEYCQNGNTSVLTGLPGGGTFTGSGISNGQFNPTTAGLGTFPITYTFVDGNNCSNSTTQNVTVNPLPTLPIISPAGPIDICSGGSVILDAGSGYAFYEWKDLQGAIIGTSQSIVVITANTFIVTVTNSFGCEAISAPTVVNVSPIPVVSLGPDTTICLGATYTLTAPPGFANYLWSNGQTTPSITVTDQGVYTVSVSNSVGCTGTGNVSINTAQLLSPIITALTSTDVCTGDSVLLTTDTYLTYLWNDGITTSQTFYANTTGPVFVTVTDATGCTGTSVPVNVNLLPLPFVNISPDGPTDFCPGGSVTLSATPGLVQYQWNTGLTAQSNLINQPGTYTVTATGQNGCQNTSAPVVIVVHTPPNPVIVANGPTTFCKGGQVILTCNPPGQIYLWSSGNTTQAINVTQTGDYSVIVEDGFGCQDSSYLLNPIQVQVIDPTPLVSVSGNTFTSSPFVTYQWYLQGVGGNSDIAIPGATSISYVATQSGTFYVVVTDLNGCSGRGFDIEHTFIGIENPEAFTHWKVFPNPAEDILTLELGLKVPGSIQIAVVNAAGQIVSSFDLGTQNKDTVKSLKVDQLPSGLYTLIVNANDQLLRTNFVKK